MSNSQRRLEHPSTLPPVAQLDPVGSTTRRSDEPSSPKKEPSAPLPAAERPAARERSALPLTRRPLYRREPWLAAMMLSFVLMSTLLFLPQELRPFIMYPGLAIGAIGVFLLIMHKPDPADEARWREYRRLDE
jgi:hypothetical protein